MNALRVKPGDQVLLIMQKPMNLEQAQDMKDRLAHWFPGVQFHFLTGVELAADALVFDRPEVGDSVIRAWGGEIARRIKRR